jgi:hypothetical protein
MIREVIVQMRTALVAAGLTVLAGGGSTLVSVVPAQAATPGTEVSAASLSDSIATDVALIPTYYRNLDPDWTWSIGPESSDPCASFASSFATPIAGCTTSATTSWFSDSAGDNGAVALEDIVAHEFFNALSFAMISPGADYNMAGTQPWASQFAQMDVGMGAISDVDAFSKCMTETVLGIDVTEGDSGDCPANLGAWVVASLQAQVNNTPRGPATPQDVGIAAAPTGYWVVTSTGTVNARANAPFYGDPVTDSSTSQAPVVGIVATRDGGGYWLVDQAGDVWAFGDATTYGSLAGLALNAPIVGMAATPDGHGYWLVAADGGVFSFGDATFQGSTGGMTLNAPITAMAANPDGGYWLVATDGGIFAFGAPFSGSMGGVALNAPVVGMAAAPDGHGYSLVASDGGVFDFGDTPFYGSLGASPPADGVTSLGVTPGDNGYYLLGPAGEVYGFGPGAPT